MVQDAEANKAADEERKSLVEAKNQGDALVHQTRKTLTELGDKVEAGLKTEVEAAIEALEATLKDESASKEQIEEKTNTLNTLNQKLAEQAAAAQQTGTEQTQAKPEDDDVIDAEVE
jgi:molecular chaperone DnaK